MKDESKRFGLNAFKALGGSWAIARWMGEKLGLEGDELTFPALTEPKAREKLGEVTFVTATDGNHGRGVAWAGPGTGLPGGGLSPQGERPGTAGQYSGPGGRAEITDLNYDDAVRLATRKSEENSWVLIQDTAWPGYEQIPAWIMEGYTTLPGEIFDQLTEAGEEPPTHLFCRPAWAALPERYWAVSETGGGRTVPSPASWSPTRPTVCTAPPRLRMAAPPGDRGYEQHDGGVVLRGALHPGLGHRGALCRRLFVLL